MRCPKVFVIVLNWNAANDTIKCVNSFLRLQYSSYELIVVDNCSNDNSMQQIGDSLPAVKIIESKRNLGYTGGNNIGIRYALSNGAEYVLIVNNDTEVINAQFLRKMVDEMERDVLVGIMGPKVLNPGGHIQGTILFTPVFINCLKASLSLWLGDKRGEDYTVPQEVAAVSGACWLIRRKAIDQIGFLDEDYFMYVEEQDYCYRARKAGWKIAYSPIESILHYKEPVDTNKARNFRQYIYVRRNLVLFLYKHFGCFQSVLLATLFLISNIFKVATSKALQRQSDFYKGTLLLSLFKEMLFALMCSRKHA